MIFEGLQDAKDLQREFAISIDEYLESCAEDGVELASRPKRWESVPLNGCTCVWTRRLPGRIEQAARDSGLSLDCEERVAQALEHSLAAETPAPGV